MKKYLNVLSFLSLCKIFPSTVGVIHMVCMYYVLLFTKTQHKEYLQSAWKGRCLRWSVRVTRPRVSSATQGGQCSSS